MTGPPAIETASPGVADDDAAAGARAIAGMIRAAVANAEALGAFEAAWLLEEALEIARRRGDGAVEATRQ